MSEPVDWRDDEFQHLVELTPSSPKESGTTGPDRVLTASTKRPPTILEYFGLPVARELDQGVAADLLKIGRLIFPEASDADEFFLILKSSENLIIPTDDPLLRVERVRMVLEGLKKDASLKSLLSRKGALDLEDVEQEAVRSGNWRPFLKEAGSREERVVV